MAIPPKGLATAALANGVQHFGDFSQSYRTLFGEMPSETLDRAGGSSGGMISQAVYSLNRLAS
jgi:hypothetical protein